MKRRVLNAAANKKAMRQCAAMTNARAPFRILCDASFLRVAFDYFRHYRKGAETLAPRALEATLPSLETLFTEMLGTKQYFLQTTLESQEDFQSTYQTSHSNTGAKKFQKQQEEEQKLLMGGAAAATTSAAETAKKPQHAPNPKLVADAQQFLRKFELIGESVMNEINGIVKKDDDETNKADTNNGKKNVSTQRRNEHKAIISTLKDVAAGKPVNGHAHPINSYLLATLNHDTRKMLKRGDVAVGSSGPIPIPTIRMTFNPWLLWVEAGELGADAGANAAAAANSGTTNENGASSSSTSAARKSAIPTTTPLFKGVTNKADRAFLEHLTKESASLAKSVSARDKFMNSAYDKKKMAAKRKEEEAQKNSKKKPHQQNNNNNGNGKNQQQQNHGKKPQQANANPLAKKAKRQRETIVSSEDDSGNSKASKQTRAEK